MDLSNYWDDFEERVKETIDCLKSKKRVPLKRLTVHLTESCNFRCNYCNMRFSNKVMSKELSFKIVDDYTNMGGKIIHFTGGEPTIVPYFEELCEYSKSKGLTVSSNTNCFKKIDTKNIDKFKVSFDTSYKKKHNDTCGIDSFDKVVENLKQYSEEMDGKMLSITAVLNKNTYKDMLELAKFVNKNFKVYNLYFSNYKGCDKTMAFTKSEVKDLFKNYIPKTLEFFKEKGEKYSYNQLALYKPDDFADEDMRFPENAHVPCYIQLSEMTIDTNGNCHNCSHLFRDGVSPSGEFNVNNYSLSDCFKGLKNSLRKKYTCLSCKCFSGCNRNLIGFNKEVRKGLSGDDNGN